jgi:quinol monooxygenase YgiN
MTIARHYLMIAAQGKEEALKSALAGLAARVRALEGCEGVEMLQDSRAPTDFMFVERWASIEAHKQGGQSLGRDALAEVMAAVAEAPKGRYMEYVPL